MTDLSAKHQMFIDTLLADPQMNATKAYMAVYGVSEDVAGANAARLMKREDVAAAVEAAVEDRSARTQVTQDWVVGRLKENVERAMQAEPVYDKDGKKTGEYTYQGGVANQALNLLGKHLGMFVENVDLTSKGKSLEEIITASLRAAEVAT